MKVRIDGLWRLLGIPEPEREYQFARPRRWRFDYAWPEYRVALEVEGGVWKGGRHNYPVGFLRDMEKYNMAALLGWRVFRFTPLDMRDGRAGEILVQVFRGKRSFLAETKPPLTELKSASSVFPSP